jgi:hypothetical protein
VKQCTSEQISSEKTVCIMGGFLMLAIALHGVVFKKQWFWCEPSREPYLKQLAELEKT